jgi:hypothetical protein
MTGEPVSTASAADARLREAFASVAETAGTGAACPSVDALWESVAGRCDRRLREAVILHLGECTACAAAWRLARDLHRDENGAKVLEGPARWFRQTWVQVAAAAAVLLIAVSVAVQFRTGNREYAAEFRGQEGDWIQSLVPEGVALPRERCLLRWTPGPVHTVYDVRMTTEDLAPVARCKGLDLAEFLVPPEALTRMSSGARIVWQVTAHVPDGSVVESRSFTTGIR